jgi:anti-sigma B factor antagonist
VRDSSPPVASATDFRLDEEQLSRGTVLLAVFGDVDLHTADELGERIVAAIDHGARLLVVDLSGVSFVDSQGIGALLRGARRFEPREGRLRLVVPHAEIRRIFEITSLDRVFQLDETREEALVRGGADDPRAEA